MESGIVISRNGTPVARLLPIQADIASRIGISKGEFEVPEDIDANNARVAALFLGSR